MTNVLAVSACVFAAALADLRWLRVAQREHYLVGSTSRFVNRWWYGSRANVALWAIAFVGIVVSAVIPEAALLVAVVVAVGPLGLSLKGRTSALKWTARLKTLAGIVVALQIILVVLGALFGVTAFVAGLTAAVTPSLVDLALALSRPLERRRMAPFVRSATARLASVAPTVVAITGSYGKTSTKGYVAHLLAGTKSVVPTPASYNNLAGLCKTLNEHLAPGTDVLVAEMGTYGPGEIAELCRLCPPQISVLTAIGPVHLERFGSENAVLRAKSEIFVNGSVCVLNVDDERLANLADELEASGRTVWRCGSQNQASDVRVTLEADRMLVRHGSDIVADVIAPEAALTNVACAIAVALELGVNDQEIQARLTSIPTAAHRQEVSRNAVGVVVIDDTFNANPASVMRGLDLLIRSTDGEQHRRVVATPGMVELGKRQISENAQFAQSVGVEATDLVVIGRTNRKALVAGARTTELNVITVDTLPEAVTWVRENLHDGDAVLYANDLPDHFP